MDSLRDYAYCNDKFIVAHRGASGDFPENTVIAVENAILQGARIIEIDIQFTNDNEIVVFHDDSLGRTAQGNKLISELNYSDIKDLDNGSWFDIKFSNEKIPKLSDILHIIKGRAFLMLEVKSYNDKEYENKFSILYDLIRSEDYLDSTLFASFDYNFLYALKHNYNANIAAIKIPDPNLDPIELKKMINYDAYICSVDEIKQINTNVLSDNNIITGVYGVDSVDIYNSIKDINLKAYGTNYPKLILDEINKQA